MGLCPTAASYGAAPGSGSAWAFVAVAVATLIAALLSFGLGVFMARIAPAHKFSLGGLAVAPLWLLLEVVFEAVVAIFGSFSRVARVLVTAAVLISFYVAWFVIRP